ncbi:NADP-dependent phosphogluconate dehydrogenase [Candidatus Liberibacter solanacearum]|uniref:6-phosphogluconate dehydrogenase, decarboxylating n=2 Tax=Candidatus Liberibacter solanacearum TaxID=556287 RepID=A0A424FNJ3_9HYPH|nr:NADP-dependent phosphogluconate dehydrogenase [Candidatus Liberibacter solanacearum]RPD37724.1 NADP-dependent phosphogluconate dehydrogenase [Candidatus Liberibacter solanacearum]
MQKAEIGIIGLGAMGSNLALNMLEKGFRLAVYNQEIELTEVFVKKAHGLSQKFIATKNLQQMVEAISQPRKILMMITDGNPVDQLIEKLKPLLSSEDILLDGGNSHFADTQTRSLGLNQKGIYFIGIGVSGGTNGARYGPSLMVGGNEKAYHSIEHILLSISANYQNNPCCVLLGPDGAGHFVKTIHNGIEYANMQLIADIYGILRDGLNKTSVETSHLFSKWNTGKLNSYLTKITAEILSSIDPITGLSMIDVICDTASQKGTGIRSIIEGHKLFSSMTITEIAIFARNLSLHKDECKKMQLVFKNPSSFCLKYSETLIKDLENALYVSKILSFTQGFLLIHKSSKKYNWNLQLSKIARIWRAGCIIRSQLLNDIVESLIENPNDSNLLMIPSISQKVKSTISSLRRIVIDCTKQGYPVPALSAALSYFDAYTHGNGTAHLIQAQRDFFGSHGFDRKDGIPKNHGPWQNNIR